MSRSSSARYEEARAHNMTIPLHQLPHELLSTIFQGTLLPAHQRHGDRDVKNLLRLTAVCSHWRDVAQNTATFWTTIRLDDDVRLLALHLRCSHNALISVYANGSRDGRWASKAQLLIPHAARVVKLDLRLWPAVCTEASWYHVSSLLGCPMPALTSLRVDANDVGVFALPPINLGLFPQLQSLTLHETEPAWDPPLMSNVTVVQMYGLLWQQQPTLDEFLRLLSSMPRLQALFCLNCGMKIARNYGGNAVDSRTRGVVPLREIRSLKLKDDSHRPLAVVLKYLSLPSTATVDVDYAPTLDMYLNRDVRDPGAIMVVGWMRRLQAAFLERGLTDEVSDAVSSAPNCSRSFHQEVLGIDKLLTIIENYKGMTAHRLTFSNIMMVVHRIYTLPPHKVHRSGEFKFRKRAYVLYSRWQALANTI
ncbi:uncharacterized protein B0H18DRAFT_84375 [Fomitopsis serialis]|uniref:uncharacterized protein n=1 Tax=Fomitopsis serialis TaxID=139415 RepID=UPI0020087267|nr:uncharacterized protein B0H18DRAFT_84375 [Neoantrodia serialis]KAH9931450.1 hypothetical protein B0H18DRAFT_84375 [Neoantrodia serialis]